MIYELTVTRLVRDEGTVVVFEGSDNNADGRLICFAADHRPAQDIVWALEAGEDVQVVVEPWQLVGSFH